MGNNAVCKTIGLGTIKVKMFDGIVRTLSEVRHVPDLKKNLISLGALDAAGYRYTAEDGVLKVNKGAMVVMKGERNGNLYRLKGTTISGKAAVATPTESNDDTTKLWHLRLGHMSVNGLLELHKKQLLKGVKTCKLEFCKYCVFGKQHKIRIKSAVHNSKGVLDYIHSDVWGPAPARSKGGAEYFVTFIDDYSRKVWVYFLKNKSEVFSKFLLWKAQVEKSTGRQVKCLRSDNGGEYTSREFIHYCESEGIRRHFTTPGGADQNGVSERMNRTLVERARSLRLTSGLDRIFWAEALDMACYLVNRSPSKAVDLQIPEELWSGRQVDYSNIRIFGCPAYTLIDSMFRNKLDAKSKECIFIGYRDGVKGYKLWDPVGQKVIISKNVIFDESKLMSPTESMEVQSTNSEVQNDNEIEVEISSQRDVDTTAGDTEPVGDEQQEEEAPYSIAQGRANRARRAPTRYGYEDDTVAFALVTEVGDPSSFQEAIQDAEKDRWLLAMTEEMESLYKNQTWDLVPLPKGKRVIGSKWVLRKKQTLTGTEEVNMKARLVAKGFAQREGVDYNEIFSPVVKHTSIRMLLSVVTDDDLELEQLDVKTAFLHGDLSEEIYMQQPEGFEEPGKEKLVCKLKKSLYGLKQSPRQWYKRFDTFMMNKDFTRCDVDSCVYSKRLADHTPIFLLLYVDDMLIASRRKTDIDQLKKELSREFDMKDLGPARKILGMEIQRDRKAGKLWLSQKGYIKKVVERFKMQDAKPTATPIAAHFKLSSQLCPTSDTEREDMAKVPYASAVGSLMYAMISTRPDIAHAVSVVSRFMANPGREHWRAVQWILRYLKGTADVGIQYSKGADSGQLIGYADSDYGGDLDRRRSTTGYVFTLSGSPISWKSTLQDTIALSTTEAEYMAAVEASKEGLWLKGAVETFGRVQGAIRLHSDSQSAIYLARDPVFHKRTKHIDIRFHKIREWIEREKIDLVKIDTKENPADMLTKPIPVEKFKDALNFINVLRR